MTSLVIPAAGAGQRFKDRGYTTPKPYLPLPQNQCMLASVVQEVEKAFGKMSTKIAVIRDEPPVDCGLPESLALRRIPNLTGGALETCLAVEADIDPSKPLLIANSDQTFGIQNPYNFQRFLEMCQKRDRAVVLCFKSDGNRKWSYVDGNKIVEKPEQVPAGNIATCGLYWFPLAGEFFYQARAMISRNERHGPNQEFYVAPVLNHLPFEVWFVDSFQGLGTPEEYEAYCDAG